MEVGAEQGEAGPVVKVEGLPGRGPCKWVLPGAQEEQALLTSASPASETSQLLAPEP